LIGLAAENSGGIDLSGRKVKSRIRAGKAGGNIITVGMKKSRKAAFLSKNQSILRRAYSFRQAELFKVGWLRENLEMRAERKESKGVYL
jgi:hypothetical protein